MDIADRFHAFAADFEACVADGQWERLGCYFAENASYANVGAPGPVIRGRSAIVEYFRQDVNDTDLKFDSRTLEPTTEPRVEGNRLSRHWRCTYTLAGAPDLVVEGVARYQFDGDLILSLEQALTPKSLQNFAAWMTEFGGRLADDDHAGKD